MNYSLSIKAYSRNISIAAIVLIAITEVAFLFWLSEYAFPGLVLPILILWVTTLIGHIVLHKAYEKNPRKFVSTYMLVTTVKLFLYLIYLVGYSFLFRTHVVAFLLTFVSGYFIFAVLDVVQTLIFLKKDRKEPNQEHNSVNS